MYVITGGGSGIGRGLAHTLADCNQSSLIIGRRKEALQESADYSHLIHYLEADVSTEKGRETIISHLNGQELAGLVHNAGVVEPIVPIQEMTMVSWHQVMSTNVEAPLFLTQALLTQLKNKRVLHIGSGAAYFPVQGWSAYCISKAALSMLTRCWQLECKEIAFASVMPGIIDTQMQADIRAAKNMDAEKRDFFIKLKERGQLLTVETVAFFLTWLLLDTNIEEYKSKEWDIYDKSHHHKWLKAAHQVPVWE